MTTLGSSACIRTTMNNGVYLLLRPFLLGSGSAVPTPSRWLAGILVLTYEYNAS